MKKSEHLVITTGPHKGLGITVPESGFRVGRDASNDLAINDETLSRAQCRFFFRSGYLWVSDLKSANGTSVNGQLVDNSPLNPGDRVLVGDHEFKVRQNVMESPGRVATSRMPASATTGGESRPSPVGQLIRRVAGIILLLWWSLLAYSLCLPPPGAKVADVANAVTQPVASTPLPVPTAPTAPPSQPEVSEVATAPAPETSTTPIREIEAAVAQRLATEQFPAAAQLISAHLDTDLAPTAQEELKSLAEYVAEVRTMNARVAAAIQLNAGKRITLHHGTRSVQLRVLAVSGTKLSGMVISTNGERQVSIDLAKLSPDERRRWLGTPQTPAEHAMHFVLSLESGAKPEAETHAQAAGRLSEAFLTLLDTPM